MGILIDHGRCIGCSLCEISCAYDAIDVRIVARVDNARCTDCTVCVDYCPVDAIAMESSPAPAVTAPRETAFDVVVIGGGVAGLSAGALLAHRGYHTLVLEKAPSLGGRFSSLKHKGIMTPTGASMIELGGPLEEVFREVGVPFDMVVPQPMLKYWVRGRWIDPGEGSGQFRRVVTEISGDPEAAEALMEAIREVLQSQRYPSGTILEWVRSVTDNEDIVGLFRAITAIVFALDDVEAADYFTFFANMVGKRFGLARRGAVHLMHGLAKSIAERGGQVWTRSEAVKITTEDGIATGVLVERQGQPWRVTARLVVSTAGPWQTARLVGPERLGPDYLARLKAQVKPLCSVAMHLISQRSPLGFPAFVYTIGARRTCAIFDASLTASWAPPGTHISEVYTSLPDPEGPVDWETEIEETKKDLDDIIPGWREYCQMKIVCLQGEFPGNHAWPGQDMPPETPIPNLLIAGDGVKARGYVGTGSAAESGQRVAALVQERLRLD
ncbi:MAG TPA: FAD-dependent oxidoreductase [Dehalococcoidia bacterium]|nr:FAD-dependent oxidoreductase [Dehalococcoidia bacterium]